MLLRLLGGKRFRKRGRPEWFRRFVLRQEDVRLSKLPFYRLHRYSGRMSLRAVDQACVVDMEHGIFFHRIPKNGNSSLVTSISQLMQGSDLSPAIQDKRKLKDVQVRPSALSAEQARAVDGHFKFFVVRNPYDRVLSAYLSKILRPAKLGKPSRLRRDSKPGAPAPTFEEFCRLLAAGALYQDRHWTPQNEYLVFPKEQYDFIARLESIDTDFHLLAEKLGRSSAGKGMVAEDPSHRTNASARRQEFYSETLYDLVYDMYRTDFEAFGYSRSDR
jgi:hypothetical protein